MSADLSCRLMTSIINTPAPIQPFQMVGGTISNRGIRNSPNYRPGDAVFDGRVVAGRVKVGDQVALIGSSELDIPAMVSGIAIPAGNGYRPVQSAGDSQYNSFLLLSGVQGDNIKRANIVTVPGNVRSYRKFSCVVNTLAQAGVTAIPGTRISTGLIDRRSNFNIFPIKLLRGVILAPMTNTVISYGAMTSLQLRLDEYAGLELGGIICFMIGDAFCYGRISSFDEELNDLVPDLEACQRQVGLDGRLIEPAFVREAGAKNVDLNSQYPLSANLLDPDFLWRSFQNALANPANNFY